MISPELQSQFQYYLQHQKELVEQYCGKVIAIKDQRVLGVFASELEALRETSKTEKPGTFLVQKVEPGEESYTQTFHSRVMFA